MEKKKNEKLPSSWYTIRIVGGPEQDKNKRVSIYLGGHFGFESLSWSGGYLTYHCDDNTKNDTGDLLGRRRRIYTESHVSRGIPTKRANLSNFSTTDRLFYVVQCLLVHLHNVTCRNVQSACTLHDFHICKVQIIVNSALHVCTVVYTIYYTILVR